MTTPDAVRSTVVDVDLDAIAANLSSSRDRAKADVIAVVKADAYGHGAEAVAETSFEAGAVMVAVATVEEGQVLREAGVSGPVLVFYGATDSSEVAHAVAQDLILVVWDVDRARAISEAATALHRTARVHFKIDTGLTRLGAPLGEAAARGGLAERSEEHTSELQSPYDLVCRLLLEKKKTKKTIKTHKKR